MCSNFQINPSFELEGRKVGYGSPVFIIAEIGLNHNGDRNIAKKMIDAAALIGVDSVKFQTFRTEEFMADKKMDYEYTVAGKKITENMFDMFKRLELPTLWYEDLFGYARTKGLIPLTSVADPVSADIVEKIGVSAYKLSSEDLINLPLLEYVSRKNIPLLLSAGMADEEEVDDSLCVLKNSSMRDVLFLHCVSVYPTPENSVNLLRMKTLEKKVNGPVGYSDHTTGIEAALGAVALGATVVEKHFTLDKKMYGPDHSLSADPNEMKSLIQGIRKMEKMLGLGKLAPAELELSSRTQFRRSIVAARDLSDGTTLQLEDLALKRPGTGLKAREIPNIVGKKINRNFVKDERINFESLDS